MPERVPPQNIAAEEGVLGSIIIDPEAVSQALEILRPEDFYRDAHRTIFQAIADLDRQNIPADFITICDLLEQEGKLDEVGGAGYISSLTNQVPTSGNAEYYANIVERTSRLRKMLWAAGQIAALAYGDGEGNVDADEALMKAEKLLREIGNKSRRGIARDVVDLNADYMTRLSKISQASNGGAITGIPSGFPTLDKLTGGFQRSDLIVLAARPGEGKTSLALNMASSLALDVEDLGLKGLFFSVEMAGWQLSQRLMSGESGIDQSRMRTASLISLTDDPDRDEWAALVRAEDRFRPGRLWVDDDASITVQEIRSRARRHQAEFGLDIVFVDYLQLLTSVESRMRGGYENRVAEVGAISRELKAMARELQVPVIALAQLNRSVEQRADKRPQLSDLRESGAVEQDSDIVLFIMRDQSAPSLQGGRYMATLILAKHRNGPIKDIDLFFDPKRTRFRELADLDDESMPDDSPVPDSPAAPVDWAAAKARLLAFPGADLDAGDVADD